MKYIIDIDGTVATKVEGDNYAAAKPIKEVIEKVNALYDAGHHIEYWTARGFTTGKDWLALTIRQLKKWGCKYHAVSMGKKQYDAFVDDKSLRPEELLGYTLTPGYVEKGKDPYAPVWDISINQAHITGEETMRPEKYFSTHMVDYEEPEQQGSLCLDVLPFLVGHKWDVVALGYVHSLRPSCVRVTKGAIKTDSREWRVTVYVDKKNVITNIEQEVAVGLPAQCANGEALQYALQFGLESEQVKWAALDGGTMYDCAGMMGEPGGVYKMTKDGAVPFPKIKNGKK